MATYSISSRGVLGVVDRGIDALANVIAKQKKLNPEQSARYTKITAYNIRQIAFNAVTVAAVAVIFFAGIALLPWGPTMLLAGILFLARQLIDASTAKSLDRQTGSIQESMIAGFINHPLPDNWNAVALRIFDIPVWRNTISTDFSQEKTQENRATCENNTKDSSSSVRQNRNFKCNDDSDSEEVYTFSNVPYVHRSFSEKSTW